MQQWFPSFVKFGSLTLCLGVFAFSPKITHAQNLLLNPSFELGDFAPNPDGQSISPGATTISNWSVINDEIARFDNSNTHGVFASDGQKSLDLTGHSDITSPEGEQLIGVGILERICLWIGRTYPPSQKRRSFSAQARGKVPRLCGGGYVPFAESEIENKIPTPVRGRAGGRLSDH